MNGLVICTGNQGKRRELEAMLPSDMQVLLPGDVGVVDELPETGLTLEENALQKARYVHGITGLPCLADDTGLEVEALGGAPGVRSARYAGEARDPEANIAKLLAELDGVADRRARFRTVLALVGTEGEDLFEGVVEGTITEEPRGAGGFGYDPVFMPEGQERTFAELPIAVKNEIGHRGSAMRKFLAHLLH